jgi:hypothetical protein
LINRYFAERRAIVIALAERESEIAQYQRRLEEGGRIAETPEVLEAVRDTAFGRVVRRAYDYRCAACGLRVVLEGGLYIVDAAHLIPFAESHDDDPRNGIALCKNHHWAMDRNLIGPGTAGGTLRRRWMTDSRGSEISLILTVDPFCFRMSRVTTQRMMDYSGGNGASLKPLRSLDPTAFPRTLFAVAAVLIPGCANAQSHHPNHRRSPRRQDSTQSPVS